MDIIITCLDDCLPIECVYEPICTEPLMHLQQLMMKYIISHKMEMSVLDVCAFHILNKPFSIHVMPPFFTFVGIPSRIHLFEIRIKQGPVRLLVVC